MQFVKNSALTSRPSCRSDTAATASSLGSRFGQEALRGYVFEMDRWVHAVRHGQPLDDVIPVEVEPTIEHAEVLGRRLAFIETEILDAAGSEIESDV